MGKLDVEPDRFRSGIISPTVCSFHNSRSATGHDHYRLLLWALPVIPDETPELASDLIEMTFRKESLRDLKPPREIFVCRVRCLRRAQLLDFAPNSCRLSNSCATKDDDRVLDTVLRQQELRFKVIHLQPQASCVIAVKEIQILISLAVTGAFQDAFDSFLRTRILFGRFRFLIGQRLTAVVRMRGRWNF